MAGITVPERTPSAVRSTVQVSIDLVLFAACIVGVILAPLWGKIACALALAVVLARLFVLGHDACHGSLFKSDKVNAFVGRLVFLPTLTTFSLWHVGHNVAHHGFANLKGRDQVWVPFSPQEFAALPKWRQRMERIYRSIWGFGLYYLVELWWNKLVFPSRRHIGSKRKVFIVDSVLAAAFGVAYLAFLIVIAFVTGQAWWLIALFGGVLPFLLWNYIMGTVIFMHHTGPDTVWFDKRAEWMRLRNVDDLSRDIHFPFRLGKLRGDIILHRPLHHGSRIQRHRPRPWPHRPPTLNLPHAPGKTTQAPSPPPARFSSLTCKPLAWASWRTIARPSPLPPVAGLREVSTRWKGWNTASSWSAGMPGPRSSTPMRQPPATLSAFSSMGAPPP